MDFFTKEDLLLLSKWASIDYDSDNPEHTKAGDKLSEGPFRKTKYWCESVAKEVNMEDNSKKNWLKQGGKRGWRFRPYAWGRIYDQDAPLTEVYFTVGVTTTEAEDPFLQFKIDYQHETPKELNEHQQELAHNLTRTDSGYRCREIISLENLKDYNWESLIKETADFIYAHEEIYQNIVDTVYKERKNYFTRICWNTNGWTGPSGLEGKSSSKNSFEGQTGFGLDEWLFSDHLKKGEYQYGYLEAKNLRSKDSPLNIDLFTLKRTGEGTIPYYVASLKNVEILDEGIASELSEELGFKKLIKSRLNRLKKSDIIKKDFSLIDEPLINIRFKIDNVLYPESEILPEIDLETNRYHRYELYDGILNSASVQEDYLQGKKDILEDAGRSRTSTKSSTGTRSPGSYEISYWHAQISKKVEKFLNEIKGEDDTVISERKLGRRSIDLVHEKKNEIIYYEIKNNSVKKGIRAALGQLLEYAYWKRNQQNKELKLVIVTPNKANRFTKSYMNLLREKFELPVYYRQFDWDTGTLKGSI